MFPDKKTRNELKVDAGRGGMTRRRFVELAAVSAGVLSAGGLLGESVMAAEAAKGMKISLRLGPPCYTTDAAFDQLMAFLGKNPGVVDEVSLFDAPTVMVYLPTDWLEKTAEVMGRRFTAFRQAGIRSVGVNVLATIGHGDEAWEGMPAMQLPPMIGLDGTRSRGCACPTRAEYRRFIRAKYAIYARANPDFIWVDDDFRMQGHSFAGSGIDWASFCEVCLGIFAGEAGYSYTREELVAALSVPENRALRQAWVAHNGRVLESVCVDVAGAVRAANPAVAMGSMTLGPSFTTYSNSTQERWMTALGATKGRPGEGFYWDTPPGGRVEMVGADRMDMLMKAFEIARQTSLYPARVTDRQAEYETFPYGSLLKNPQTAVNECLLALISGCNGIALNTFGWGGGPYEEYQPLFQTLTRARPVLQDVLAHAEGLPARGLWSAWSADVMAKRTIRDGESWFKTDVAYDMNLTTVLTEIGVPLSAERCGLGSVLTGRIAETFDDDELRSLLAEGVMMDTLALRVLTERGLGELAGVRVAGTFHTSVNARLTDDALNGPYAGAVHDAHQLLPEAFRAADVLEPLESLGPQVRVLAELRDFLEEAKGVCMTAYENRLGGRVVVVGYSAWWYLHSAFKRFQTVNAADWIAKGRLPVRIEETCAVAPFIRMNGEGTRGVVVLLNTALGPVETVTVSLRLPEKAAVRLVATHGVSRMERFQAGDGWGVRVRDIPAWSAVCLLVG